MTMTVDEAKKRTKTRTDDELAAYFGVTRQAVVLWRAAGVPIRRQHEIELAKKRKRVAS
jgi:hypothetical protein